jgi:hypothetical protein
LGDNISGSLSIVGIDGKVVYQHNCKSGTNTEVIDLTKLERGVYLYTLKANGQAIKSGKIVKN